MDTVLVGKVLNFLDGVLPDGECNFACVVEAQTLRFSHVDLQSRFPGFICMSVRRCQIKAMSSA